MPLTDHINLQNLDKLERFRVHAIISEYDTQRNSIVVSDITSLLSTIPASNSITNLYLSFGPYGQHPWPSTRSQDWKSLCDQIKKVSSGREVELEVDMGVDGSGWDNLDGRDLLPLIKGRFSSFLKDSPWIKFKWTRDKFGEESWSEATDSSDSEDS